MGPANTNQMGSEACNRLLREVAARVEETIRSCGDEQVHDLRVSIRRLRQSLRAFAPDAGKRLKKRLKNVMRHAGSVRNLDIALQYAEKWQLSGNDDLAERRQEAARELTQVLKRWVEKGWSEYRIGQRGVPPAEFEATLARNHARKLLISMAADFFLRGATAASPNATTRQMHRFRIASKKFRYTMELFAPAGGPALDARIGQVRQLQSVLGEINDCATLRTILSGDEAASRLLKKQHRKIAEFRKQWKSEFGSAATERQWKDELSLLGNRNGPQKPAAGRPTKTAATTKSRRRRSTAGGA